MAIKYNFKHEIDNDKKRYYKFNIAKNLEKGGSWHASYVVTNREGSMTEVGSEAFSSSAPAKRWCAGLIGRSRLGWDVAENKMSMTSAIDVKL